MDFVKMHEGEVLSDNTRIKYCEQCADCIFWGNGDDRTNSPEKASCDIYPFPGIKPDYVIDNTGECKYKQTK